ncbi:nucleotidyltransferase family protein [Nocardioides sp.]|uniref:nucleotidyltransferase family protein n=1 Tax=Nocardioides sp. TaxID=35761 RepID=UPI003565727A
MVARVACDTGVRALAIKGPILGLQGLRGSKMSRDVDFLVHPRDMRSLVGALRRVGWFVDDGFRAPSVTRSHSIVMRHAEWPCEIDLHHRFPGFLASPDFVFEFLWECRTSAELAGASMACCDVMTHGSLAALHYIRDRATGSRSSEFDELLAGMDRQLTSADKVELGARVARLGATETLRSVLELLDVPVEAAAEFDTDAEMLEWRLAVNATTLTSLGWVVALRGSGLRRWPSILWQAAWLNEADLRRAEPSLGLGRAPLLVARMRRLGRGLRALPRAIWAIARLN